jgi:hypothetical protein
VVPLKFVRSNAGFREAQFEYRRTCLAINTVSKSFVMQDVFYRVQSPGLKGFSLCSFKKTERCLNSDWVTVWIIQEFGFDSLQVQKLSFCNALRPVLARPISVHWEPKGPFPVIKQPERESGHTPPPISEVKMRNSSHYYGFINRAKYLDVKQTSLFLNE